MPAISRRTVLGPAHYASYFINADASGLEDYEEVHADNWFAANVEPYEILVDADGEPFYSNAREAWEFEACSAGDVLEYVIISFDEVEA